MVDLRSDLQQTLGGSYTIERELTGGGMSRVFVALDATLGRRVVVKVLSQDLAASVSVERFKREIMLAATLQHPHIVGVLTAGEIDGMPYFTMPFVEGESLRARVQREGALQVGRTVSILKDVARALSYAHERGVVHRDIKPDNVLLAGTSATVTDFGIAKALLGSVTTDPGARTHEHDARDTTTSSKSALTQLGTTLGTPAYMAPEQAAADPATDHRADIYSFGIMAYEMLTGQVPFKSKTPQALLAAQLTARERAREAAPERPRAGGVARASRHGERGVCLGARCRGETSTESHGAVRRDGSSRGSGDRRRALPRANPRRGRACRESGGGRGSRGACALDRRAALRQHRARLH